MANARQEGLAAGPSPLIVALDVDSLEAAERLIGLLRPQVENFKVGLRLFTALGPRAIELVRRAGGRPFLDLKFHDIPNTVAQACEVATSLGAWMITLHAQGGEEMLQAAVEASRKVASRLGTPVPHLLGVTVLTSVSSDSSIRERVVALAETAKKSGLAGVVCSASEARDVRRACGPDFLIVTPGIRLKGGGCDDQARPASPSEARKAGVDYLVVGRPVIDSPNPKLVVEMILSEIR